MGDAVIVSTARTAIGTARKGTLLDVSAFDLAKHAVGEALKRSGIAEDDVDDLQMGESLQGGGDIARYAAVELGLTNVPGVALNRHCASGMAAVQGAAASIRAGHGQGRDRRRRREHLELAGRDEAGARDRRHGAVDVAEPSRDAGRTGVRHVDHRRLEHRAEGRTSPARRWTTGRAQSHRAGDRRDRRGQVRGRDLPDRGDAARR